MRGVRICEVTQNGIHLAAPIDRSDLGRSIGVSQCGHAHLLLETNDQLTHSRTYLTPCLAPVFNLSTDAFNIPPTITLKMLPRTQLLALGLSLAPVHAWFRMACPGAISRERLDPVVSPGKVSGHTHIISGGSNFGPSYSHDHLLASNCTSCTVGWFPLG